MWSKDGQKNRKQNERAKAFVWGGNDGKLVRGRKSP